MVFIYVLRCVNGKYYVGKTDRAVDLRFAEHLSGNGSQWTKKYPPIEVVHSSISKSNLDEDIYVKQYMQLYGIDNVRGGSYVSEHLKEYEKEMIQKKLDTANNRCFRCSGTGHFARDCTQKNSRSNNRNNNSNVTNEKQGEFSDIKRNSRSCYRCGMTGHYAHTCYVTRKRRRIDSVERYDEEDSDSEYEDESGDEGDETDADSN
jgi:predicted GIY-YIG superfamily endonuclease